jgi:hypothetical protein
MVKTVARAAVVESARAAMIANKLLVFIIFPLLRKPLNQEELYDYRQ